MRKVHLSLQHDTTMSCAFSTGLCCIVFLKMEQQQENKLKPIKQFSVQEVSAWINENMEGNIGKLFEGEFFFRK